MFAILVPVSLAPLITTLLWAENKAKKLGIIEAVLHNNGQPLDAPEKRTYIQRILRTADQLDIVGLTLLGTSVALILLPLTLSQKAKGHWHNGMCG